MSVAIGDGMKPMTGEPDPMGTQQTTGCFCVTGLTEIGFFAFEFYRFSRITGQ